METALIILASILGAEVTFYLIHAKRVSAVRASSGSTLAFALLTMALPLPLAASVRAAFFGATFVGMTSNTRMGKKRVLAASLLFAAIYILLVPSLKGLGGGLGSAAFVASSAVYGIQKIYSVWRKSCA